MSTLLLPVQQVLQPKLPTIEGHVDYRRLRDQLSRINELLLHSGLEEQFIAQSFEEWAARSKFRNIGAKAQRKIQIHARRALRCNIARTLMMEDYRDFAIRLADSPLFQQFCGLAQLGSIQVPAKSTLQRYSQWTPVGLVNQLINRLTQEGHLNSDKLGLKDRLDLEAAYLDCTCIKANIHYPVDWVLLRDATRTLMKRVILIRAQGLRQRMEAPEQFLKRMNALCIQMTHARGEKQSKKQRKKLLRAMDKLVKKIAEHARRYRKILEQDWEKTNWTRGRSDYMLRGLDNILDQLPEARRQARERIIGEQQVPSKDKILSLYEPDVQVIVRKKAGAEVEFGNTLLVSESQQGIILDWELFKDVAPRDSRMLSACLKRTEENLDIHIRAAGADRGFDSKSNRECLEKRKTYNAITPLDPRTLKKRQKSWKFKRHQRRRAQSEGRIGILKNRFLGRPLRNKGFPSRELAVSWAMLTHNLWVMARLPQGEQQRRQAA